MRLSLSWLLLFSAILISCLAQAPPSSGGSGSSPAPPSGSTPSPPPSSPSPPPSSPSSPPPPPSNNGGTPSAPAVPSVPAPPSIPAVQPNGSLSTWVIVVIVVSCVLVVGCALFAFCFSTCCRSKNRRRVPPPQHYPLPTVQNNNTFNHPAPSVVSSGSGHSGSTGVPALYTQNIPQEAYVKPMEHRMSDASSSQANMMRSRHGSTEDLHVADPTYGYQDASPIPVPKDDNAVVTGVPFQEASDAYGSSQV